MRIKGKKIVLTVLMIMMNSLNLRSSCWFAFFFCIFPFGFTVAAVKQVNNEIFILSEQQWAVPRTAESILAMAAIHQVMMVLSDNKNITLRIGYPGGEVGILWASDLKGWLVSLGLSSVNIKLQAGSLHAYGLELSVDGILK